MNGSASYLDRIQEVPPGKDDHRIIVLQKDSCVIYIGGNALSNERIIVEHEHPGCLVFHAWGAKGAYVVLCKGNNGTEFTDSIIDFAAQTALKHSRSELRSVSFSRLSELVKPDGAPVGVFRFARQGQIEVPS